jgi:hypothetical protein
MTKLERITYNVKLSPKASEIIEKFKQEQEEKNGQPCSNNLAIDLLVKEGAKTVTKEK